jgi:hypothetical protein
VTVWVRLTSAERFTGSEIAQSIISAQTRRGRRPFRTVAKRRNGDTLFHVARASGCHAQLKPSVSCPAPNVVESRCADTADAISSW